MAARYWVGGGSSQNWNATGNTNWGTASGVQDNASVPTSVDDVIFDGAGAGGNSNSIISATITVKSLTINAGYTATMTHNAVLTIAGNWTMSNTHTIAGSSDITINYSGGVTINTNSQAWPNNISIISGFGIIVTLTSNFVCNGTTSCTLQTVTINRTASETWSTAGLTVTVSSDNALSGTAEIILTGGTWSGTATGIVNNNLTINGNVTVSGSVGYNTGTLKYTSGTVTTTGSTLTLKGGSVTLNTNGITWNNISITSGFGSTITLTSNFICSGTTSCTLQTVTINKTTTETWSTAGLTVTVSSSNALSGTSEIVLTGGTWSGSGTVNNNLTINGDVIVSGSVGYTTGTLKYTSGTVTTASSTIVLQGGTLNTNGITWNNVNITGGFPTTITLTSNFTCAGTTSFVQLNATINKTSSEIWSTNGISISANVTVLGTAEIILTGGTWSSVSTGFVVSSLTFAGNVIVSGSVNYRTGTLKYTSGTVTTTGSTLNIAGSCTLNTNGISWNNVSISTTLTVTLTSNFTSIGTTTIASNVTINKSTTETWSTNGLTMSSGRLDGNGEIVLTGGTWTANTNIYLYTSLTFNGNSTVSGVVYFGRNTLKYTSGTITTTGSTLTLFEACTLNTNGMTWNNVSVGVAVTLTSNFTCTGSTTTTANFDPNKTSSETWSTAGLAANAGRVSGTAEVILTGGTWTCGVNIYVYNPLTFAGNVTVSGTVYYGRNTLKYTSGTITTIGSTLTNFEACTFDTNGISWNNLTFLIATTTINSLLTVSNTLTTPNAGFSFTGTSGFTCGTLLNASTTSATITLKDGNTYTVNTLLDCYQSRTGSPVVFTSSHATNLALLVLTPGANCRCLANFTRIDASGGRPIYTFNGTVTNCVNVKAFNDLTTIASSYVNL